MKKSKRILSLLLAVVMLVSALSASLIASAADVPQPNYSKRVTKETVTELVASLDKLAKDNLEPLVNESLYTNAIVGELNAVLVDALIGAARKLAGGTDNAAEIAMFLPMVAHDIVKAAGVYENSFSEVVEINFETGEMTLKKEIFNVNGSTFTLKDEYKANIKSYDYGVKDQATFKAAIASSLTFICSSTGLPGLGIPLPLASVLPTVLSVIEESIGIDVNFPADYAKVIAEKQAESEKAMETFMENYFTSFAAGPFYDGEYIAEKLVDAIFGVVDQAMVAPVTFVAGILPNLANFITGQNGIESATNHDGILDLAAVMDLVGSFIADIVTFDKDTCNVTITINGNKISVPGTTLKNYTTDEEFKVVDVAGLVNALLPVIADALKDTADLSALEGLELPQIDWALLAERGEKVKKNNEYGEDYFFTLVDADTADVVMTLFDYLYEAVIADSDNFKAVYNTLDAVIPESDTKATIMSVVGSLQNMSEERVILTLVKLLPKDEGTTDPDPTDPTVPTDPTDPTKPTDPTNPTDKPTEPTDKPTEPDNGNGGNIDVGDAAISVLAFTAVAAAAAVVIAKKKKED